LYAIGPQSKSEFQRHSCFELHCRGPQSKKQCAKKEMQKLPLDHLAKSKKQEAKCQQQSFGVDWILTIT